MQAAILLDLDVYLGIDEIVFGQRFGDLLFELVGSQALGPDRADKGDINGSLGRYGQRYLMLFFAARINCDGQNITGPDPVGLALCYGMA